jgi:hypothetical protein
MEQTRRKERTAILWGGGGIGSKHITSLWDLHGIFATSLIEVLDTRKLISLT